jgi:hypothetical protein
MIIHARRNISSASSVLEQAPRESAKHYRNRPPAQNAPGLSLKIDLMGAGTSAASLNRPKNDVFGERVESEVTIPFHWPTKLSAGNKAKHCSHTIEFVYT